MAQDGLIAKLAQLIALYVVYVFLSGWAFFDPVSYTHLDPAWRRGLQYLLETQAGDGSWHVASRLHPPAFVSPPYFESGYPYGHD